MSYNLPTVTENKLSFGPGIVYLGVAGATPTTEVGAVEAAMTLTFKRVPMDLYQGGPKTLVKRVCVQEDVEVNFTGLELSLQNLQWALGAGELTSDTLLEGGGDMDFDDLALKFVHQMVSGGTVTVSLWRVNGAGEADMNFGEEWIKFPMKFIAQNATTDWASQTLAAKKQLYKIQYEAPPA